MFPAVRANHGNPLIPRIMVSFHFQRNLLQYLLEIPISTDFSYSLPCPVDTRLQARSKGL